VTRNVADDTPPVKCSTPAPAVGPQLPPPRFAIQPRPTGQFVRVDSVVPVGDRAANVLVEWLFYVGLIKPGRWPYFSGPDKAECEWATVVDTGYALVLERICEEAEELGRKLTWRPSTTQQPKPYGA